MQHDVYLHIKTKVSNIFIIIICSTLENNKKFIYDNLLCTISNHRPSADTFVTQMSVWLSSHWVARYAVTADGNKTLQHRSISREVRPMRRAVRTAVSSKTRTVLVSVHSGRPPFSLVTVSVDFRLKNGGRRVTVRVGKTVKQIYRCVFSKISDLLAILISLTIVVLLTLQEIFHVYLLQYSMNLKSIGVLVAWAKKL